MDRLVTLGLGVAAVRWLRIREASARMLAEFLTRPADAVLSIETLDRVATPCNGRWADMRMHGAETQEGANRIRVHICRLTQALTEVGFPHAVENIRGSGYRMSAASQAAIRAALEASL